MEECGKTLIKQFISRVVMDLTEVIQYVKNNWWILPAAVVSTYSLGYVGARFSFALSSPDSSVLSAVVQRVPETPLVKPDSLELRIKECADNARWDRENLKDLLETAKTRKVTMFGLDHGEREGDVRDGQFIAGLLPQYAELGWDYVAIEGPTYLNASAGSTEFEERVGETYGQHWTELGPIFREATRLKMKIVFYDPLGEFTDEREESSFDYLKENIFEQDPEARVIVCCGINHAFKDKVKRGFLYSEKVTPLGMRLHQYLNGDVTRVLLQPEKPVGGRWRFDYSFYLEKQCSET